MLRTIKIDEKEIQMASNAFTPILYRQIFKRDFIREITSLRKLAGKTAKTMTDSELGEAADKTELFTQLAFVMAKQAELKTASKLMELNLMSYYEWLTDFEAGSFQNPETMKQIVNLWRGNAEDKNVDAKNSEGREPET